MCRTRKAVPCCRWTACRGRLKHRRELPTDQPAGARAVGDTVVGRATDGSVLLAHGGRPRVRRVAAVLPQLALVVAVVQARRAAAVATRHAGELAGELTLVDDSLRRAAASKDEFLATLSHELRTPLNAMLGWIQLLRLNADDAATRARAISVLERSARAQVQIVADLLDVSQVITGEMHLALQPVDFTEIVQRGAETLLPSARARMVTVEYDLQPITGVVHGDAGRLRQIVWNLLSNAIKFTPTGGRVTIAVRQAADHVALEVSDTGVGIAADVLPYVFDRFRQGDSSITRAYGGLGLGLAIVRHLAELHGGSVSAASEGADRGATFVVRLPLQPAGRAAHDDPGSYYARGA